MVFGVGWCSLMPEVLLLVGPPHRRDVPLFFEIITGSRGVTHIERGRGFARTRGMRFWSDRLQKDVRATCNSVTPERALARLSALSARARWTGWSRSRACRTLAPAGRARAGPSRRRRP